MGTPFCRPSQLTFVRFVNDGGKRRRAEYRCACGNVKICRCDSVKVGAIKSCGCMSRGVPAGVIVPAIVAGDRFTRLVFLGFADCVRRHRPRGRFHCDCGAEAVCDLDVVMRGETKSCGCIRREKTKARRTVHGESGSALNTPEYRTWKNMRRRCRDPRSNRWALYGGRGIKVCEDWDTNYAAFPADMGRRPSPKHSIDRKDNNGNYEPGNCRWATAAEQRANQRRNVCGASS
jgi:hypothetical protein